MAELFQYEEALDVIRMKASVRGLSSEEVLLECALGRVAAEAVVSHTLLPPFKNSAMDGFAIQGEAEPGAVFKVLGTVAAGDAIELAREARGVAWQIMTGAPVPEDFDSVVRVEDVTILKSEGGQPCEIRLNVGVKQGENVRDAGEDFTIGTPVIEAGARLGPEHILALASLGVDRVLVSRRPRVALISTGRELVPVGSRELKPGEIRNSTLPYLQAAFSQWGADCVSTATVTDEPAIFAQALREALAAQPDIVLTTGAVSMGIYDFIPTVLEEFEAEIALHKVAIRPGKPLLFAELPGTEGVARGPVIFGLPGNPVSTAVGVRFFVEPYLREIAGQRPELWGRARLVNVTKKPDGLRCFYKARVSGAEVEILPGQASFMVSPLLDANAWAILPEDGTVIEEGATIDVVPLHSLAEVEKGSDCDCDEPCTSCAPQGVKLKRVSQHDHGGSCCS